MLIVKLREQKQVAAVMIFSLGFFIYGVAQNNTQIGKSTLIAKQIVSTPHRGIASE